MKSDYKKILSLLAGCLLIFSACGSGNGEGNASSSDSGTIKESGNCMIKDWEIEKFSSISVAAGIEVVYVYSEKNPHVKVYTSDNIFDALDIKSNGQTLNIEFKPGVDVEVTKLMITAFGPELTEARVAGEGSSFSIKSLKTDKLTCSVAGSSKFEGKKIECSEALTLKISGAATAKCSDIKCENVVAEVQGTGKLEMEGTAENIDFDVSGEASIKAPNLAAGKGKVKISGTGNVYCNVKGKLQQDISGSGKLKKL